MTEIVPTHIAPDDLDREQTRHGRAVRAAGTECKIVDLVTGAELGPNQQGEIWMRGPAA